MNLPNVNSVKVFDPDSLVCEVYARIHLQRCFTFMGCSNNDAYQMTRMFFKTLTKSVRYTQARVDPRFVTTSSGSLPFSVSPPRVLDSAVLGEPDYRCADTTPEPGSDPPPPLAHPEPTSAEDADRGRSRNGTRWNYFSPQDELSPSGAIADDTPSILSAVGGEGDESRGRGVRLSSTPKSEVLTLGELGFTCRNERRRNKDLVTELAEMMSHVLLRKISSSSSSSSSSCGSESSQRSIFDSFGSLSISRSDFHSLARICLVAFNYTRRTSIDDFIFACHFVERKEFVLILLAGSSGSGKSTLASSVAIRLGLGKLLSTDSVRHFLRSASDSLVPLSELDRNILCCSSYTVGARHFGGNVVEGYVQHCKILYPHLEAVLDRCAQAHESVVMEGVHLTPEFMVQMMKKYPRSVLGFVVHISNQTKYLQRFSVRSKHMTLDPQHNQYAANFENILQTSDFVIREAKKHGFCLLDNDNIDASVALLHHSIFQTLKHVHESGVTIYEHTQMRARKVDGNRLTTEMIEILGDAERVNGDDSEEDAAAATHDLPIPIPNRFGCRSPRTTTTMTMAQFSGSDSDSDDEYEVEQERLKQIQIRRQLSLANSVCSESKRKRKTDVTPPSEVGTYLTDNAEDGEELELK